LRAPKKAVDRIKKNLKRYQNTLQDSYKRDDNESNTVIIIGDMLSDLFGYEKYTEITTEFEIKGQYCDLALKIDDNIRMLIEVKAIGKDLKDNHLIQICIYFPCQPGI